MTAADDGVIMRYLAFLRTPLLAVLGLLTLALAITPFLIQSSEQAMDRALRHDVAWIGVHGREEFHELTRLLLEHARDPVLHPASGPQRAYEIIVSRLDTWRNGGFRQLIAQIPDGPRTMEEIAAVVERLDHSIARLPEHVALEESLRLMRYSEPIVDALSRAAFTASTDDMTASRKVLAQLQLAQRGMMVGLVAGGFLMLGLLMRHNRLLASAHEAEKAAARENAFLATHDSLTRLENRASVMAGLSELLELPDGMARPCVLMIDLDGFKPVNDVLGHKAGDVLLMSVAERLRALLPLDVPAYAGRFGGDEFVVVLGREPAHGGVSGLANEILASIKRPHNVDGHHVSIDASIGVAIDDGLPTSASDLVNHADIALARAKGLGKGRVLIFEPGMGEDIAARQRLESDMAGASFSEEFVPYYQPIVDLASGRIVAVEALARWQHPVRGLVSPAEFIPVAESCGRIVEISWTILEQACRDASLMPADVSVAVNLSAVQLMRADVREAVGAICRRTGIAPSRLKLEITESVLINDAKSVRTTLQALQEMGVAVALDDFGTGYSSLSYLSSFGFNELKIDRSFVSKMANDPRALSIVQTIVLLARHLEMRTVAEGIETREQARLLHGLGCVRGQGYLYGRPEPIDVLLARFPDRATLRSVA